MDKITIFYNGQEIEVDKPVADYLETERRREQNEQKSDKRHLSDKNIDSYDFDEYIADKSEDFADKIAEMDTLKALTSIQKSIVLDRIDGLTIRDIAQKYGVSRNAISKRLKTIRKNFCFRVDKRVP